jgi:hypothetical protein
MAKKHLLFIILRQGATSVQFDSTCGNTLITKETDVDKWIETL